MRIRILFLCLAVIISSVSIASGEIDKSKSEDDIREIVFRYEIHNFNSSRQFQKGIFFLSIGLGGRDPDDQFMKRFSDYGGKVKRQSLATREISGVKDMATGQPGLILTVNRITWISETEERLRAVITSVEKRQQGIHMLSCGIRTNGS